MRDDPQQSFAAADSSHGNRTRPVDSVIEHKTHQTDLSLWEELVSRHHSSALTPVPKSYPGDDVRLQETRRRYEEEERMRRHEMELRMWREDMRRYHIEVKRLQEDSRRYKAG